MAVNRAKLLESADKLVRQGKLDEAIKHYAALSEDNPRDVNTINRIGDLYVRLRKNKEAIRQFMRIADFYAGDGFHLKAIAMYKKITKLEPSHIDANERLADLYAKQGLVIEARTQFLALAEQCLRAGQKPKAVAIYQKIQALEPDNLKVRVILADLLGKEGDPAQAVDGFVEAAAGLRKKGMDDEALKILYKALRLQPGSTEVQGRIAEILRSSRKKPQELTATAEHLCQASPQSTLLLEVLAECYLKEGRAADFRKLQQGAKSPEVRLSLTRAEARHLHARGESEAAAASLQTALEGVLRDLGPARGAALLEEALKFRPEDPAILERILDLQTTAADGRGMESAAERLVRLWFKKQDWDRAAQFLARLQDMAPEHPALAEIGPLLNAKRGIGAAAVSEAPPMDVPSLDELEKVVELEPELEELTEEGAGEDSPEEESIALPEGDQDAGERLSPEAPAVPGAGGEETGDPGEDLLVETGPFASSALDASRDSQEDVEVKEQEGAEEQDSAYAGRSVIQEMREEPEEDRVDKDFLAEHFTEAEVFLKYGLAEKAKEQLQTILARYADHIPSLKKLKEIHAEEGKKAEAAAVLMKIAAIHRSRGEEEPAREMEEQARDLDPSAGSGATASVPAAVSAAASPPAAPPGKSSPPASVESDLDLDLDLPEPSKGSRAETASVPAKGASPRTRMSAPAAPEEEFRIDLLEEGLEEAPGREPGAAFDPDKASQFDFYLEQKLVEEAEQVLAALERAAPGHPGVQERRARLNEIKPAPINPGAEASSGDLDLDVERAFGRGPLATAGPTASEESSASGEDGFFDLAAELKAQVLDSPDAESQEPPPGISSGEEASIDEIFKAFRKKVDQQVEEEDYETRYNLGIAYKEMGLLDEAIGEFQYASREPKLFLECCSILGICFREKGMTDLAIKWYRKALESRGHSEERYQGLRYDLGELYVEKGDYPQALSLFSEVYGTNSNYRDVASRIRELKKRVG
jgi:tetratricopeptide (TPR) repeat protein